MSFKTFLSGKAVSLIALSIGGLCFFAVCAFAEINMSLAFIFMTLYTAVILLWLSAAYIAEKQRFQKLSHIIEQLPQKYLLGEVLPYPKNSMEQRYFQIIECISHSAIGAVEKADREKEDYCDYVEQWIHEIKTPLTACALIASNGGDTGRIRAELKRADNLTENILYYARLRTAAADRKITEFHAAEAAEKAVKSQMELMIASKISVEINGDFLAASDCKAVIFIIKQLLINCAKYCEGCHVKIDIRDRKITVTDNGIGILPYELSRVTDRGFTGTNGKRVGESTGMGLYIVRKLCEDLDIGLFIDSEPEKYTCVTLDFGTGNLTKM